MRGGALFRDSAVALLLLTGGRRGCAAWAHPDGGVVIAGGDDHGALSSTEVVTP